MQLEPHLNKYLLIVKFRDLYPVLNWTVLLKGNLYTLGFSVKEIALFWEIYEVQISPILM
ncbi:hypothetical protein D3C72_552970 [compost metagenome]